MQIFNFQFSIFNKFSKSQFSNVFGFSLKAISPDLVEDSRQSRNYKLKADSGFSALMTTIAVLLLLLTLGVSIAISGMLEGLMSEGQRQSQEAYFQTEAGARDAMMKIARNKNFSTSTGYFIPSDPSDCSLYSSTACAKVIVEKDAATTCSQSISAGQDCIISLGTLNNSIRKVEVILNVNATSGKMTVQSWNER